MATRQLKFVTYNTHLFGGNDPTTPDYQDELRREKILKELRKKAPDIVCLQEVWGNDDRAWFVEHSGSQYPYSYYPADTPIIGASSGLLVLSNLKITNENFTPFAAKSGLEKLATKGFVMFETRDANGSVLARVVSSHLQAGDKEQEVRKKQFAEILKAVKSWEKDASYPSFICGDFNVIAEYPNGGKQTSEYQDVNRKFNDIGMFDMYRDVHAIQDDPGYTYNTFTNRLARYFDPDGRHKQRLDYIYYNKNVGDVSVTDCCVETHWKYSDPDTPYLMDNSDHYPIVATYSTEV